MTDTEYTIGQILVDEAGDFVLFLDEGLNFLPDGHVVADVFTYEVDDGFGGTDAAEVLVSRDRHATTWTPWTTPLTVRDSTLAPRQWLGERSG